MLLVYYRDKAKMVTFMLTLTAISRGNKYLLELNHLVLAPGIPI